LFLRYSRFFAFQLNIALDQREGLSRGILDCDAVGILHHYMASQPRRPLDLNLYRRKNLATENLSERRFIDFPGISLSDKVYAWIITP